MPSQIVINGTTGIANASWTTATRPSSPVAGQQGYNTDIGALETYTGSTWSTSDLPAPSTAGNVLTSTGSAWTSSTPPSTAGGATSTTSGTNVTLTSASNRVQNLNFTAANLKLILPNATTLSTGGPTFVVTNSGSFPCNVTLADGGSSIVRVNPLGSVILFLTDNSTSNGSWTTEDASVAVSFTDYTTILTAGSVVATTVWNNGYLGGNIKASAISSTSALVTYSSGTSGRDVYGIVLSISGTTITYGSATLIYSGASTASNSHSSVMLSSTNGLVMVQRASNCVAVPITVSGTTISVGTASATFGNAGTNAYYDCLGQYAVMDSTTLLISTMAASAPWTVIFKTIIHNGASAPTIGSNSSGTSMVDYYLPGTLCNLTSTTALWTYPDASTSYLYGRVITISGSSAPTLGTATTTTLLPGNISDSAQDIMPYKVSSTEVIVYGGLGSANWTISGTTVTYVGYVSFATTSGVSYSQPPSGLPAYMGNNLLQNFYATANSYLFQKAGSYVYNRGPITLPYPMNNQITGGTASCMATLSTTQGLIVTNAATNGGPVYASVITYIGI